MTSLTPPGPQAAVSPAGDGAAAATAAADGAAAGAARAGLRWRPWHGRARTRDLLCVAAIAASALYSAAMIPLTPLLIATHPVLLEMLAGSNASVLAAGAFSEVNGHLSPAVVVAAAMPAMMRSDWVLWWAGRLWGHRIVDKLGRHNRRAAARVSLAQRRGVWFAVPLVAASAFLPGGTQSPLYAASGWLGLPLLPFLLADLIGTAVWVSLLTTFGYLLGRNGVVMAGLVSHYALLAVSLPLLSTIAPHAWRAWRHRARRPAGGGVPLGAELPSAAASGE